MNLREEPVAFECQGSELIGMLHIPPEIRTRGLITVVAGGPQYRGGVGRQQVQLARALAAHGIPILRFDYRGLGDSEGQFRGFQDVEDDLRAAIRCFQQQLPEVKEFVFWGGCDAASAIMINAWKYPEVTGIILGNPWVHDEQTSDAVTVKQHYAKRVFDKDFWLKVIRLQYNPIPALRILGRAAFKFVAAKLSRNMDDKHAMPVDDTLGQPFILRMLSGLSRFRGDALMLMSGKSLFSKEFDELVANETSWQQALNSPRSLTRHEIADADQTFSSSASRHELIEVAVTWLLGKTANNSSSHDSRFT